MGKGTAFSSSFLSWVLNSNSTPPSWFAGPFWISLHNADPSGGNASTNEAVYGGYSRLQVNADNLGAGWTVSSATASNNGFLLFPICVSGGDTITHFSLTTAFSGATQILWSFSISAPLVVAPNVQPQFPPGALQIGES
jgi:hypothetical protein